ncbi:hypothetical protein GCM10017786_30670 [Amycolatopsis deserti]|uniref:Uncharacterized protein n=1 Tax=Amycolatopsis deserti TaxID=185696 RepID=A0ABQ3IYP2_9PSEU|nr:hypothetical protein [Amycolatopsis deserti]GHE96005.1 hypothetical protein GCM10017786_30670 [Amycolatopsis deserti]
MADTVEEGDFRWCLRGCAWMLLYLVIGFGWFLAVWFPMRWYHRACNTDIEPGTGFGLLFVFALELVALVAYSGLAGWLIVRLARKRVWRWLVPVVVIVLAGAVLVTWAFWVWEVRGLVVPTALNRACLVEDPPGWPSFLPIPR